MTIQELYQSALSMVNVPTGQGDTEDYEERAPYLAAAFCTEAQDTDNALRAATGEPVAPQFNAVYIPLDSDFPLLDVFSVAASLYLAAMLIIDEDEELSDKIYERYCDEMSRLSERIPCATESIADRYSFRGR